jgi:hypothetical protein
MVFEQIESLKREYTDKYVVVDAGRPELARFDGQVGLVKTINMNGRALVEFQDYIANIGWYDIDLDFLKVVPKPEPAAATKVEKPAAKKAEPAEKPAAKPTSTAKPASAPSAPAAKKPAAPGEKKLSPLELARMQGAAKREGGAAAPAKPSSVAAKAADTSPPAPSTGATKQPTTAEILAAARTKKAPTPPPAATAPVAVEPAAVTEHAPVAVEAPATPSAAKAAGSAAPRQKLSTAAEKIAWCRENDAGRSSSG